MDCPVCARQINHQSRFCLWCDAFIPAPRAGRKASGARRLWAHTLDWGLPTIGLLAVSATYGQFGGPGFSVAFMLITGVVSLYLLSRGQTLGKMLADVHVVNVHTGRPAGFWCMFGRDWIGKFVSGFIFGLGYLWVIFDRDNQAWHDKMFSTVVVHRPPRQVAPRALGVNVTRQPNARQSPRPRPPQVASATGDYRRPVRRQ